MGGSNNHLARTVCLEGFGGSQDGATGVNHVVDQNAVAARNCSNNLVYLNLIWLVRVTTFVDDCQWGAQTVSPNVCHTNATRVRRDNS